MYCEEQGTRIVHPAVHGFHGRDIEFEKVLLGERLFRGSDGSAYTNNHLYVKALDRLGHLEDDYIYSDYVLDPDARKVGHSLLYILSICMFGGAKVINILKLLSLELKFSTPH